MKKIILIIIALIIIFLVYDKVKAEEVVIPEDSIRLRVIPNSNSNYDIVMKMKIKEYLKEEINNLFKDTNNIEQTRSIIKSDINNINNNIQSIFNKYNYNLNFKTNYGYNYFPEKEYKGVIYKEGYYESLVVSIGAAKGDNWWCCLFPNLCLIDSNDVEYKSLVKTILEKII